MMIEIGRYILIGVIALFALALFVFIGFMVHNSLKEKKAQEEDKLKPRADSIAELNAKQFTEIEQQKSRTIHTKSRITVAPVKETTSAFRFKQDDAEPNISLESQFENGPERTFLPDETH